MKPAPKLKLASLALALVFIGETSCAQAQSGEDFYKDKQIRLISGHPVGGDYDVGARFLAKYLSKHIPGEPAIVVQNMPQAASIAAANFLYNQAPRDGTVIGSFSRNFPSSGAARPIQHQGRPSEIRLAGRLFVAQPHLRRLVYGAGEDDG